MRSPLYVAVATRLYRKAIDFYLADDFQIPEKELAEIEIVFNREFTEGFIRGDIELVSPEKPMNRWPNRRDFLAGSGLLLDFTGPIPYT